MNRAAFYKSLRRRNSGVFGTSLSQQQVDGCEAIIGAGRGLPLPHLAHCMAEAYHETGATMAPVRETFAKTDDQAIARLERAWAKGQLSWVSKPYWRKDEQGRSWLGRGFVQLTWRDNYEKAAALTGVDLVGNPNAAMRPKVAAQILCEGCRVGMFTGKKLADFDGVTYDHASARAIVNGDKNKVDDGMTMGDRIAGYAHAFEAALAAAGYRAQPPLAQPETATDAPKATEVPEQQGGLWAALLRLLRAIGWVK